jgi:sugar lactone lactonase YvrE
MPISCLNDVAVDHNGNIWLVDNSNYVIKLDSNGNYVTQLGKRNEKVVNNAHFYIPKGIAVDSHNNIYISDWKNSPRTDIR